MRIVDCLVTVLLGGSVLTGCLTGRPGGGANLAAAPPASLGSFTVTSGILGDHVMTPSACTAGDRQLFLGADFNDSAGGLVIRLVVDPLDGPAVRIFSSEAPFDKSVVFRRSDCASFHFSIDATGWRINDLNDYRISLELDCSRPGESVKGSAATTHCH